MECLAKVEIALNVPFSEKDQVKSLSKFKAKWNGKSWSVPAGTDLIPLVKWLPEPERSEIYQLINDNLPEEEQKPVEGMSLYQLLMQVKNTLNKEMPHQYWVKAEVLNTQNNRHFYLELTDYGLSSKESAKCRAMIWQNNMQCVERFVKQTGMEIKSGMKLLLQVSVDFHPQFGLSLVVNDIDSRFTLGDMEQRLQVIRASLTEKGILQANKSLVLPKEFTYVAVIAPENAAGLGDFQTQANILAQSGLCQFDYYSAVFQGPSLESTFNQAFSSIEANLSRYDAVVIIRGGGDKAGLYELNSEKVAERLCRLPIPVIVGIGHERDNTLLDELACLRCPTPSLVISHIVGTIISNGREAIQTYQSICSRAKEGVLFSRKEIESLLQTIQHQVTLEIREMRQSIKDHEQQLALDVRKGIEQQRQLIALEEERFMVMVKQGIREEHYALDTVFKEILTFDPAVILNRGYSVVTNQERHVIRSADQLASGDKVTLRFHEGMKTATID